MFEIELPVLMAAQVFQITHVRPWPFFLMFVSQIGIWRINEDFKEVIPLSVL